MNINSLALATPTKLGNRYVPPYIIRILTNIFYTAPGIIAKLVYDQYCANDPNNFKEMNARFTSHVFPGETYVVDMWK